MYSLYTYIMHACMIIYNALYNRAACMRMVTESRASEGARVSTSRELYRAGGS